MEKISKKDIKVSLQSAIEQTLTEYGISEPSAKTKRMVKAVSKRVSKRIKTELKKSNRKGRKAIARKSAKDNKPSEKGTKVTAVT